jgi:ATP-dependent DNA ligase
VESRSLEGGIAAAFTRNRNNWLDRVPGLEETILRIPGKDMILDGELFGTIQE